MIKFTPKVNIYEIVFDIIYVCYVANFVQSVWNSSSSLFMKYIDLFSHNFSWSSALPQFNFQIIFVGGITKKSRV